MDSDLDVNYEELWLKKAGTEVPAIVSGKGGKGFTYLALKHLIADRWGRESNQLKCSCVGKEEVGTHVIVELLDREHQEGEPPWARVVSKIDLETYHSLLREHPLFALQEAVSDYKNKLDRIDTVAEDFVRQAFGDAERRIEEEKALLTKRRDAIEVEVKAGVESRVDQALRRERDKLEADKASARELENEALKQLEDVEIAKAQLNAVQEEARIFREKGGPEFMRILRRATPGAPDARIPVKVTDPPADFFESAQEYLVRREYEVDQATLARFVLAAVTAMATGQLVLLSGPTGVGKTSLVRRVADLLGAGPDSGGVIPVRPAWLDPADLVGFYNSAADRYESTPFVDELIEAQRYAEAGEPTFIVLDEMNLARIENYGADLLALLEKSRENLRLGCDDTASLQLYSDATAARLDAELAQLVEQRRKTSDDAEGEELDLRIGRLRRLLKTTPSRLQLPPGVVLFGTLNADETTHALSPKVKDRSFVLQLPAPKLSAEPSVSDVGQISPQWQLTHTFASSIKADGNLPSWAIGAWNHLVEWQDDYLTPLGVHLSRRFASLFRFYTAAAVRFGLPSGVLTGQDIVSGFLAAKLLPWIAFHKDDEAKRGKNTKTKADILSEWTKQLDGYPSFKAEVDTIIDSADLTYEYVR